MKNLTQKIAVFVAVFTLFSCTFAGAQTVTTPVIPPMVDHYSWALPLSDIMSYARQSVRNVSGWTHAKTALDSSPARWVNFGFKSPRNDGVVLIEDINKALVTNRLDLIIAESENSFGGNINLANSESRTLFNGGFWVDTTTGNEQQVNVTYWLAPEIDIPVPLDLHYVQVSSQDAWGRERTDYFYGENGRMRIRTDLGNNGTAKATFNDGSQINFNLSNGMAESEKRVTIGVTGEFAHTCTFVQGETTIVFGVSRWGLDGQGQYTAIFEPEKKIVLLYAEIPEGRQAAHSVRLRSLSHGVVSEPFAITSGVALSINLYDILGAFPQNLGVWEAVFTFPTDYYGGYSSTTGAPIPVTPLP